MSVLTAAPDDRDQLLARWDDADRLVVVALCAAWCDTCTEFREAFARIAAARSHALFIWLDIEDDHALCGDIDVENFPTLAIFRGSTPLHFGISLPHEGTVARLIDALARDADTSIDVPDAMRELPRLFRADA